jgi:hypothetical protein
MDCILIAKSAEKSAVEKARERAIRRRYGIKPENYQALS